MNLQEEIAIYIGSRETTDYDDWREASLWMM